MFGLIFDVDGILADTEKIVEQATIKMFRDLYNLETYPEDYLPYIGTGAVLYTQGPADKYGVKIDIDHAVAVRHEYFVATLASGIYIGFPGTKDLIDAAHAAENWKLAIATSSPGEKSKASLKAARVPVEPFNAYIHGDMITHKKPHPEIYLKAASELGLEPTQCIAVEDSTHGVESAKNAGMRVLAVTNTFPEERLQLADFIVPSVEKITLAQLESIISGN